MDLLARLRKLAQSGNERFIILNESGDDGFVLLPLAEYERLMSGGPRMESIHDTRYTKDTSTPEHKSISPQDPEEIRIKVKLGAAPSEAKQTAQPSQNIEDEEKFYLEPLS